MAKSDSADTRYFKTDVHGLSVVVGSPDPTKGEVAPKTVDFEPFWEQRLGVEGQVKVGFLATDNGSALKKLENDPLVTEISKDDFEAGTADDLRAPH